MHGDITIPSDAEGGGSGDGFPWKKLICVSGNEVFDEQESVLILMGKDVYSAAERVWNRDKSVAGGLPFRIEQTAGYDDLKRRNIRRWPFWIDGEWGEQRENEILKGRSDLRGLLD